jgi:hypothetical protein
VVLANKDKPFRHTLYREIAALQGQGDRRGLRRLARALIEQGAEGDVQCEVADRLDGRVAQSIAGDDELPPAGLIVTGVVRAGDAQD